MAHLSEIYLKAETLETLLKTVKAKGEKGVSITIASQDEVSNYGQNVSAYVSQSKEDREAKKPRYYVGNGKTFWSDGKPPFVPERNAQTAQVAAASPVYDAADDLPF
jgi:hypothetical protein